MNELRAWALEQAEHFNNDARRLLIAPHKDYKEIDTCFGRVEAYVDVARKIDQMQEAVK